MKKRILCGVLSAVLLFGLFTGCKKKNKGSMENDLPETQPSAAPEAQMWRTEDAWRTEQQWQTIEVELEELDEAKKLQSLGSAKEKKQYTLMIYMVGSDLESRGGAATSDIKEMFESGIDTDACNIVIYTGGCKHWHNGIVSEVNGVYTIQTGQTAPIQEAATQQLVNMGDPAAFLDFLNFAYENYPAENYALVCWDHGAGPLKGFGSDELHDKDSLSLPEMDAALAASPFAKEKLRFLGFDACLMASVEVADMVSPYAEYMIASQELEPGGGWDYRALKSLATEDTETLGKKILKGYEESLKDSKWDPEYTLSLIDLSQMDDTMDALDGFYSVLQDDVMAGEFSKVAKDRENTKRFGVRKMDLSSSYDLVDLRDLAQQMLDDHPEQAQALLNQMDKTVLDQVSNVEKTGGLTIYHPYDNKHLFETGGADVFQTITDSQAQKDYIKAFSGVWLYGELDTGWTEEQITTEATEETIIMTIPSEYLPDVGKVYYHILQYGTDIDVYEPVYVYCTAQPDENGTVTIEMDHPVYLATTDQGSQTIITTKQIEKDGEKTKNAVYAALCVGDITGPVENIIVSIEDQDEEVTIRSIEQNSTDVGGRQEVDPADWNSLYHSYWFLYETMDADGELLPWYDWENSGWAGGSTYDYSESFFFERSRVSQMPGEFFCQIEVRDICGETIFTQMFPLQPREEQRIVEIETEKGLMQYELYDDHAVLSKYEGEDFVLELPKEVEGVPLTEIGNNAINSNCNVQKLIMADSVEKIGPWGCSCRSLMEVRFSENLKDIGSSAFAYTALTQIKLPDGLVHIGASAFADCLLKKADLPGSVESIGDGAFQNNPELKQITVNGADGVGIAYSSKDGVLYSADGKTLVFCPPVIASGVYTVAQQVETIGTGAFYGCDRLSGVILPEGVRRIGIQAFYEVGGLRKIQLPQSLEEIGACAFGTGRFYNTFGSRETVVLEEIFLGPNVRKIGASAFGSLEVRRLRVSEENPWYSTSENGLLLNKTGDVLLQVPKYQEDVLVIPDGVSHIDEEALSHCTGVTQIVYPDSALTLGFMDTAYTQIKKITIGKNMVDLSELYRYKEDLQVIISEENPYYTVFEGSVYTKNMEELVAYFGTGDGFEIPEGVKTIRDGAMRFVLEQQFTTLGLPSTLQSLPVDDLSYLSLRQITVAQDNPYLAVYDGLVYSKDGTKLIYVPRLRTEPVVVREGTVEIGINAFGYSANAVPYRQVMIPEGVTTIRSGNFGSAGTSGMSYETIVLYLPESLDNIYLGMMDTNAECFEVHCPAGSKIDAFAREKGAHVIHDEIKEPAQP